MPQPTRLPKLPCQVCRRIDPGLYTGYALAERRSYTYHSDGERCPHPHADEPGFAEYLAHDLTVHSAPSRFDGDGRLDISATTGGAIGRVFAPSAALMTMLFEAQRSHRGAVPAEAWTRWHAAYLAEMRRSYKQYRPVWSHLLAQRHVVLVCACADAEHCHRTILRRDVLPRLGARDGGEVTHDGRRADRAALPNAPVLEGSPESPN
jgi:uncharacterized protein YeaO (DUF488 family)